MKHWKTRYEVAQAYIDIVHEQEEREIRAERNRRKRERQKQKKKKRRNTTGPAGGPQRASGTSSGIGGGAGLALVDGGAPAGDRNIEPETMAECHVAC
ncbi:MAG: hypothetical protein GY854_26690 [Deltaproteobacteria bacterium]|nr:hypothetical protein [Deltaproteobacteria bacterium]